jgi:hypothetical protein
VTVIAGHPRTPAQDKESGMPVGWVGVRRVDGYLKTRRVVLRDDRPDERASLIFETG